MLSTGSVLLLVAFITPNRTRITTGFAGFAIILLAFALFLLSQLLPSDYFALSPDLTLRLFAVFLIISIVAWFNFVVDFLVYETNWIVWSARGLVGISIIGGALSLLGEVITPLNTDTLQFNLNITSLIFLAIAISYSAVAIFLVWQSDKDHARWLRVPSILIALGYILTVILPNFPIYLILFKIATLWVASAVIRQRVLIPMQNLNQELSVKSKSLQKNIVELEHEKSQVEQLNSELENSNRYKSEFLANMSHELRTPLNAIIGYSELLTSPLYGALNKQQADRVERIHRNGKHLTYLIDTILDMSKLQTEQLQIKVSKFDIQGILPNLLSRITQASEEKSLTFEKDIQAGLPLLRGDSERVEQILQNLLDNAIKFTDEGRITLHIQTITVKNGLSEDFSLPMSGWLRDGQWMLFQVRDTGIGIAQEDLGRIFVNFTQLDSSRNREFGGIGLGLSITKELVESHFGMIWVQSEVGVGSTFFVALPITS